MATQRAGGSKKAAMPKPTSPGAAKPSEEMPGRAKALQKLLRKPYDADDREQGSTGGKTRFWDPDLIKPHDDVQEPARMKVGEVAKTLLARKHGTTGHLMRPVAPVVEEKKKLRRRVSYVLPYKPPEHPHVHKSVESIANLNDPIEGIHFKADHEREEMTSSQEPLVQLRKLARIFQEADEDKGGGLDALEFREAMRVMGKLTDDEADMIFMKVDTDCDALVDWDEFLRYMFLEIYEKAQMRTEEMQPFPKRARLVVAVDHREEVVRVVQAHNRYISIGRDGVIGFWTTDMESKGFKRIEHETIFQKSIWVTDCALMPRAHVLALCSTACDIQFYDINVNRFERLSRITSLNACPMSIAYFETPDEETSCLYLGDSNGSLTCISIDCPVLMSPINPKRSRYGRHIIPLNDIINNHVGHLKGYYLLRLHGDIVRDIMYSDHLGAVISVCKHPSTAMHVGDMNGQRMSSYYKVPRGISTVDYSNKLNIIVTGGPDAVVRVWNPYVTSRAVTALRGHQSAILRIHLNVLKEQIVSIAENKEIRVHDLDTQTCVQLFHRQFIPLVGNRKISASLFNAAKQELVFATTWLAVLGHRDEEINHQQLISHKQPVVAVLYNPLFERVVTTGADSVVAVWAVTDGQKDIQYRVNVDSEGEYNVDESLTAMCFDSTYRRLITGGRDGQVCIWNFNSGACLRTYPASDTSEITSVVCDRRCIITGGWNGHVTLFNDDQEDFHSFKRLTPAHKRDLLSIDINPPNVVAASSFDGHIFVWYLSSNRLTAEIDVTLNPDGQGVTCEYRHMYGAHRLISDRTPDTSAPPTPPLPTPRPTPTPRTPPPRTLSKVSTLSSKRSTSPVNVKAGAAAAANTLGVPKVGTPRPPATPITPTVAPALPDFVRMSTTPEPEDQRPDSNISSIGLQFSSQFVAERQIVGDTQTMGISIEKIVFLREREQSANTATLFAACGDGLVRAWSLTHDGGLLGQFAASHYPGDSLTTMVPVRNDEFLVTSDTAGYLKVWDVSHYALAGRRCCIAEHLKRTRIWLRHPLLRWMARLEQLNKFAGVFPHMKHAHVTGQPHLLTSLRAHVCSINGVDYCSIGGTEYLLTASLDCSVRMWTISGQFVGLFGQQHLWNFGRRLRQCARRAGRYRADGLHRVPPDVLRVASSTTLHVLYQNTPGGWTRMANSVRIACSFIGVLREKPAARALELPEQDIDWQLTSVVLGKYYTPRARHRPMPVLPKPALYKHQKLVTLEEIIPQCMPAGETRIVPLSTVLPPLNAAQNNIPSLSTTARMQ